MKKQQSGFTLIELIAVIVILGILGAVAIPRFVNLQADAQLATTQAIAGSVASASAMNYAQYVANQAGLTASGTAIDVSTCDDATAGSLMDSMPTGYAVSGATATTVGEELACTLTHTASSTVATFSMMATDTP